MSAPPQIDWSGVQRKGAAPVLPAASPVSPEPPGGPAPPAIDWSGVKKKETAAAPTGPPEGGGEESSKLVRSVFKARYDTGISEWVRQAVQEQEKKLGRPLDDYGGVTQLALKTIKAVTLKGADMLDFASSPLGLGLVTLHLLPYTRWMAGIADEVFAAQQGVETAKSVGHLLEDRDIDSAANAIADSLATSLLFVGGKETLKNNKLPDLKNFKIDNELVRQLAGVSTSQKNAGAIQGILRHRAAEAITDNMKVTSLLMDSRNHMDTLTPDQHYQFIHNVESSATGRPGVRQLDPTQQRISNLLTTSLDKAWDDIIALNIPGVDQHFYENYFPRFYKEFERAQTAIQNSYTRRPFTGAQGFRYKRSILGPVRDLVDPTVNPNPQLHLVTTNPVDLTLMKLHELRKFKMALVAVREAKDSGLIERVLPGQDPTPGWKKINDHIIPKSEIPQGGSIWAPTEVAKSFNNFLGPGLQQWLGDNVPGSIPAKAFSKGTNLIKGFNNATSRFLVSWSAFHGVLSTAIASANEAALGIDYAAHLKFANAGKAFARSLGWAPIDYFMKGGKLMEHAMDPTVYPQFAPMLEALQKGGGRPGIDTYYRSRWLDDRFRGWIASNRKAGGSAYFPRAMQRATNFIMGELVPKIKLGSAMRMFEVEAEKWGPGWESRIPMEQQREVFGKIVDSIDNRHGQMIYDNIFWPRIFKDLGFMGMQFMGFTMGTVREAAGGVQDLLQTPLRAILNHKAGRPLLEDLPNQRRLMWTLMAMPFIAGMTNVVAQWYMTGQGPDPNSRKIAGVVPVDYIYPWNGKYLPNGEKERITLPPSAYLRVLTNPAEKGIAETVKDKLSNGLQVAWSIAVSNQDFQNRQLWDPSEAFWKNVGTEMSFVLERSVEPIPFQQTLQAAQRGEQDIPGEVLKGFWGVSPAPMRAMRSSAENLVSTYGMKGGQGPISEEQYDKRQAAIALADQLAQKTISSHEVMGAVSDGRITANDARKILRQGLVDPWHPKGYWGSRFITLEPGKAFSVWRAATPAERGKIAPLMVYIRRKIEKERNPDYRRRWLTELNKLLAEYQQESSASSAPPEIR